MFMKALWERELSKKTPNFEIPELVVIETKFNFDESAMRKAFKVLFRHFFSSLIHADEEISLQTGQEIFREAKLNTGKKIIRSKKQISEIAG